MPVLPASLLGFTGTFGTANGVHQLTPTWDDLVRAAITTGYPNLAAATMPATFHRNWAVLYRAAIVLAFLDADDGNRLVRSSEYDRADRSEKGAISYHLGLFGAKYAAERLLRTPWLWHYDAYHQLAHGVGPISQRPDLLGRAITGEWIVIEAKGRTNGWTTELRTSAKAQARTIGTIVHPGGAVHQIDANVASITYFEGDGWSLMMDDPPAAKSQPLRLGVSEEELFRSYYQPLLSYIRTEIAAQHAESVSLGGTEYVSTYDGDLELYIGLAAAILESGGADTRMALLASAGVDRDGELVPRRARHERDDAGRIWSVGADGVIVRLGQRWH